MNIYKINSSLLDLSREQCSERIRPDNLTLTYRRGTTGNSKFPTDLTVSACRCTTMRRAGGNGEAIHSNKLIKFLMQNTVATCEHSTDLRRMLSLTVHGNTSIVVCKERSNNQKRETDTRHALFKCNYVHVFGIYGRKTVTSSLNMKRMGRKKHLLLVVVFFMMVKWCFE